jgi:hypothetical protein
MNVNDLYPANKKEIILKELRGKTIPQLTKERVYDIVIKDAEPRLITEDRCYLISKGSLGSPHTWESKKVINGLWIANFLFSNIYNISIGIKGTFNILVKRLLPYYAENEIDVYENGIRLYTDIDDTFLLPQISKLNEIESVEIPELKVYNNIYIGRNEVIINKLIRAEIDYHKQYIKVYNKIVWRDEIEKTLKKYLR